MRCSRLTALAALALSALGCASVVTKLRPNYVDATSADAAILTVLPAPGHTNFLSGVQDPARCQGALNLGGTMELEGERKVRLEPGREFAFAVNVFQLLNGAVLSCEQMVVFTPEPRTEYRAQVVGTPRRCQIELKKVVEGAEVTETGARHRMMRSPNGCLD